MNSVKTTRMLAALIIALTAASCGPSKEESVRKAFAEFHEAVKSKNLTAVRRQLTVAEAKEFSGPDADMKLAFAAALLPDSVEIVSARVTGSDAELEVKGVVGGNKTTGKIKMKLDGESWRIANESWKVDMGSMSLGPSFLSDPSSPPQLWKVLEGHQDHVSKLAWTPDGRFLISASYGDFTIRVWNAESGGEVSQTKMENRPTGLAVSPSGSILYTTDAYDHLLAWSLSEGTIGTSTSLVSSAGQALAISHDGKLLATTGFGKKTQLWNASDASPVSTLDTAANQRSIQFTPKDDAVVSGGDGNTYSVVPIGTAAGGFLHGMFSRTSITISKVSKDAGIAAIDVSGDGKWLATGHNDSSIVIFDLPTREETHNFFVRDAATRDLKFSPDGHFLATAQNDRKIYIWDAKTGGRLAVLENHTEPPVSLAWSPDSSTLASGGEDRRIVLWRSAGRAEPRAAATPAAR